MPAGTTAAAAALARGSACAASGIVRPVSTANALTGQWSIRSTPNDATYDLTGVTSTAYPAVSSPFAVGVGSAGLRTCVLGGTVLGKADPAQPWNVFHDSFNAACLKIIAVQWMQVRGLRCDNVEDGIRPEESGVDANNTQFAVSGTHLSHIRDDCMENDYTVGGLLQDNLWEQCNTGVSERPSGNRQWPTPAAETLTLDHMLIGLYPTPHVQGGHTVTGENALFKWSASGNHVVIRCSVFKVDSLSLNGAGAMGLPPGTVVDDSACPANPSTIVWLGGGRYPAATPGLRVVSDPTVWTAAVAGWKAAHSVA